MAYMIPKTMRFHTELDHEEKIYKALRDRLPKEYKVIHSFHSIHRNGKIICDCQCDFLIFHPEKGFLSIEAKAGKKIKYEQGEWYFDDKTKEKKFFDTWSYGQNNEFAIQPFEQADRASKELRNYVKIKYPQIVKKTKFTFAVWFPDMNRADIVNNKTPEHFEPALLLTNDDLLEPQKRIEKIFSLDFFEDQKVTKLTKDEVSKILDEIIDPSFVAVSKRNNADIELDFIELLEKQQLALNFMQNEKSVTVIGGAGTGKTILAKQQAKNYSKQGEKVLLLCYNWMLCEEIQKEFENDPNVKVMTVDSFALWLCKSDEQQVIKYKNDTEKKQVYKQATDRLLQLYGKVDSSGLQVPFSHLGETYKHIIIDEAQDLGKSEIEDSQMIETLQELVLEGSDDGSFVALYDSLQNIQSAAYKSDQKLPELIKNSFCRIPLSTNCRNTIQIDSVAKKTYLLKKIIKERLYKSSVLNAVNGKSPSFYFCMNKDSAQLVKGLDTVIDSLLKKEKFNKSDIAILTLKTEEKSFLSSCLEPRNINNHERFYYKDILVSSCRKFKGCERKAIILIDFSEEAFSNETNINMFYVGATRAIYNLSIITCVTKEQAHSILVRDIGISEEKIKGDDRKFLSDLLGGLCLQV